jgi:DNA-3-methyladenine glycosylase II
METSCDLWSSSQDVTDRQSAFKQVKPLSERSVKRAARILAERDPDLARIYNQYGAPPLWAREQGFSTLIHIILEQQVSLASARAAHTRLVAAANPLTPERFLQLDDAGLRAVGFSRQKTAYGRELALALVQERLDLARLEKSSDAQVHAELSKIKGIGRWTTDIYLLMALRRPDIWPRGDLALAVAVKQVKGFRERPTDDELVEMSARWKPYRAVAARMFWHYYLSTR